VKLPPYAVAQGSAFNHFRSRFIKWTVEPLSGSDVKVRLSLSWIFDPYFNKEI